MNTTLQWLENNLFDPSPLHSRWRNYISRRKGYQKEKKKKTKMSIWCGRTRQISNSEMWRENSKASSLSFSLSQFFCICNEARRTVHTRLGERKGWKWSVRVTYFRISLVCQRHQRVWRVGGILRTGAGWSAGLVGRDLKAFRCKHPLLLANSAT